MIDNNGAVMVALDGEVFAHVATWRTAALDSPDARESAVIQACLVELGIAHGERDRARDTAVALEQEVDHLTQKMKQARALAGEHECTAGEKPGGCLSCDVLELLEEYPQHTRRTKVDR